MNISNYSDMGTLSLVEPHQVHGSVGPAAPETLGPRVLELSSILQTTLDLKQQIILFAEAIQNYLNSDGIVYSQKGIIEKYQVGNASSHRATYDLTLEEETLGTLHFYREMPFTNKEIKILENLLCGLVYPLRNALSYLEALQLASHDPLTGVQNRFGMDAALEREVELAHRQDTPLSVLMIDADHFKQFNDNYGHAFGDEVLRALANSAASTIRGSDLLFRFGGEEFVVLASHTEQDGAALLAERIRERIEHITAVRDTKVDLSVSIGVATLSKNETVSEIFERADEALYQAKEAGRNRVVIT